MITIYRTSEGKELYYSHADYGYIYIPPGRFDIRAVGGPPPEQQVVFPSGPLIVKPNEGGWSDILRYGQWLGRWIQK